MACPLCAGTYGVMLRKGMLLACVQMALRVLLEQQGMHMLDLLRIPCGNQKPAGGAIEAHLVQVSNIDMNIFHCLNTV